MSPNKDRTEELARELGIETVSIFVGPKRKQYTVHKELLCKAVPFFCKAFGEAFNEAEMGEIYLSDENDNPAAVELFIHWLYKDAIPSVPREGIWRLSWEFMDTNGTLAMLRPYHDLYYIAEKWCAPLLKDEILDKFENFTGGLQLSYIRIL
ncbi:hypothetical protein MMC32_006261 [Xylographa parallela]|nr:hypothetical protein [Xylographa parallela]